MFMPELGRSRLPKQTQAVMFDPQQEREAKRKRQLAELLIQQGNAPQRNETAGGMTVKRSPWENINQAAQRFTGEMQLGKADEKLAEAEKRRQEMIVEALSNPDQMNAAKVLAQDPNTSDAAIRMYSDILSDQRRAEQMENIAGIRAASGGNTPAAIQIAEDMLAQEKVMYPERFQDPRYEAERRFNLIGQSAKTYGFDRLTQYNMPQGGGQMPQYMPPQQGMDIPQGSTLPSVPQQGMQNASVDPLQQHAQAVMQQQAQTGVSPMQRPELSFQAPSISSVPGADQVMAQREGTIEAEKERAKLRAKYMEEGRQSLPKMERALKSAELRRGNIERVVNQVSQTAQRAFTTGFTGSIANAIPGTPAYDLKMNLQTLEATAAFDTLQNMRDNSPTGGALGNVSEKELDLLKAAYSNLSNSQSYEQFMQNLDAFNRQHVSSLQNIRQAYDQDYQRFGGQSDQFLPPPVSTQPQSAGRDQIIQQLRNSGIPEDRIQQYIQAKGL